MSLIAILALWGTIVSSIALTWNIIRGSQDKKKIKIEAQIGHFMPGDAKDKVFYVTVTNIRRRPVFITGWGALRKKKKGEKGKPGIIIISPKLPKMLKDGDYEILHTEDLSIFSCNELTRIQVWDSTGKKWKVSRKNMRQLLKTAKKTRQKDVKK